LDAVGLFLMITLTYDSPAAAAAAIGLPLAGLFLFRFQTLADELFAPPAHDWRWCGGLRSSVIWYAFGHHSFTLLQKNG
jgi:hypothetical protein